MHHAPRVEFGRVFYLFGILAMLFAGGVRAGLPDFTDLVEKNSPAVVNISTTQVMKHPKMRPNTPQMPRMPDLPEGPFGDLFRKFFDEQNRQSPPPELKSQSLGSGFIISKDGYVVTNHHVIKDAKEIIVKLSDRRQLVAKLIGSDEQSDIALLKIDAKDLPVVKMDRSKALKPGEWVLAIGSPFGFETSVTAGVVSATERSLPSENYVPFIQSDVAINPGNSGGPLFDLDGNVVGVNSQIYSRTGGFMGLSFSIPVSMALNVAEQLKTKGKVTRGWLGVQVQDVSRELAESMQLKKAEGALVARVLPTSPAEQAGMKVGDVIVEFDGKEVNSSSALPPIVGVAKVGSKVDVKVVRDGKVTTLGVKLGELPGEESASVAGASGKAETGIRMGMAVMDLNDEMRRKTGIEKGGVQVAEVAEGPAAAAGVRRGDVILMINNSDVKDLVQFKELIKALPAGKTVRVLVQRGDGPSWLAIKLAEDK